MAQIEPNRPLHQQRARTRSQSRSLVLRLALLLGVTGALGGLFSQLNLRHDLSRLKIDVLSGDPAGNYHRLVQGLATLAAREHGLVRSVVSQGSAENVARLSAASQSCQLTVGLAQDRKSVV